MWRNRCQRQTWGTSGISDRWRPQISYMTGPALTDWRQKREDTDTHKVQSGVDISLQRGLKMILNSAAKKRNNLACCFTNLYGIVYETLCLMPTCDENIPEKSCHCNWLPREDVSRFLLKEVIRLQRKNLGGANSGAPARRKQQKEGEETRSTFDGTIMLDARRLWALLGLGKKESNIVQ